MVDAVADEGAGQDALVAALMELCEALSFCAEDGGRYFPTEAAVRALARRPGGGDGTGATPDMILLSVRAIMYLCDAMPRARGRHRPPRPPPRALLPSASHRVPRLAEQCLQAFEKISQRQPTQCLQAGMINAVHIDFFTASIQRVAVSAVANACKKVPADCSQSPGLFWIWSQLSVIFCSLSQDKVIVEKVAACLISIVDSFSTSVDLVDQLCHQGPTFDPHWWTHGP